MHFPGNIIATKPFNWGVCGRGGDCFWKLVFSPNAFFLSLFSFWRIFFSFHWSVGDLCWLVKRALGGIRLAAEERAKKRRAAGWLAGMGRLFRGMD